jgi:hypothetical protein
MRYFSLSVNYPVQVFFERKTGQAPLGAGYRGSIIWGSRAFRAADPAAGSPPIHGGPLMLLPVM